MDTDFLPQGHRLISQATGRFIRVYYRNQVVAKKQFDIFREKAKGDIDCPFDACLSEDDRLTQFGNSEVDAAGTGKRPSGHNHAVSVGISLDHSHYRHIGPGEILNNSVIVLQGRATYTHAIKGFFIHAG